MLLLCPRYAFPPLLFRRLLLASLHAGSQRTCPGQWRCACSHGTYIAAYERVIAQTLSAFHLGVAFIARKRDTASLNIIHVVLQLLYPLLHRGCDRHTEKCHIKQRVWVNENRMKQNVPCCSRTSGDNRAPRSQKHSRTAVTAVSPWKMRCYLLASIKVVPILCQKCLQFLVLLDTADQGNMSGAVPLNTRTIDDKRRIMQP